MENKSVIQKEVVQSLIALKKATSKDQARHHLGFIQLKKNENKVVATAVDGYILVSITYDSQGLCEAMDNNEELYIGEAEVLKLNMFLKTATSHSVTIIEGTIGKNKTLSFRNGNS